MEFEFLPDAKVKIN